MELPEAPFFRAVMAPARDEGERGFAIAADAWDLLKIERGAAIAVLPIE